MMPRLSAFRSRRSRKPASRPVRPNEIGVNRMGRPYNVITGQLIPVAKAVQALRTPARRTPARRAPARRSYW